MLSMLCDKLILYLVRTFEKQHDGSLCEKGETTVAMVTKLNVSTTVIVLACASCEFSSLGKLQVISTISATECKICISKK